MSAKHIPSDQRAALIRISLAACKAVGAGAVFASGESNSVWGELAKGLEDAEGYYQDEEFTQKARDAIKLIDGMTKKISPEIRAAKILEIEVAVNKVLSLYK
jgi:hypothetical protein